MPIVMRPSSARGARSYFMALSTVLLVSRGALCWALMSTLSPIEKTVLRSRLLGIEAAVREAYGQVIVPNDGVAEQRPDTFIFPGAGGLDVLVEELEQHTPNSVVVDWKEHRGSIVTAAYDGEAVGETIARLVVESSLATEKRTISFIGISVGGFCANAAATIAYQELSENSNHEVRLTLLDPFCGRGLFGGSYGKEYFGKYATTAVQILNTDDPVPTTNEPLPYCHCVDVTAAVERNSFAPPPGDSMHSWPLAWYARHYEELQGPFERGKVLQIQ